MSRTITNVSDDQNSWTTDQSYGTTTSTTVVREANAVRFTLSNLENIATYYENHQESARLIRNIENCNI